LFITGFVSSSLTFLFGGVDDKEWREGMFVGGKKIANTQSFYRRKAGLFPDLYKSYFLFFSNAMDEKGGK